MRGELVLLLVLVCTAGCLSVEKQQNTDIQLFPNTIQDQVAYTSAPDSNKTNSEVDTMKLTSPEFEQGKEIPSEFTCDDADISPPLQISNAPKTTKSFAIIMDDPDAPRGTFVHWLVWNIPPTTREIKKGEQLGVPQGRTDFGTVGYGGPCPPGGTHRYYLRLYALDTTLELAPAATRKDLERSMQNHILDKAELMGIYTR